MSIIKLFCGTRSTLADFWSLKTLLCITTMAHLISMKMESSTSKNLTEIPLKPSVLMPSQYKKNLSQYYRELTPKTACSHNLRMFTMWRSSTQKILISNKKKQMFSRIQLMRVRQNARWCLLQLLACWLNWKARMDSNNKLKVLSQ